MDSVNVRYGGIWKLLTDYNFDSNKRCYPDLICVICNKLLRNAHQNECGCRYCFECIQLYSQNNDKPCPGKTEECNEKTIDLVNDIQEDYTANKKISMIMVTCPILNCQYADYLMNMEEHVHSHQVECPYIDIGCTFHRDIVQNVNAHLNQESYAHSKLISGSILELKINLLPMIEKLHRNHAEELNEYFLNSFKVQEEKIANLQSENEQFRKQLENILNQSHNVASISSSEVTEDLARISNCQNDLNGLEKIVTTTITINNNSAHLENINRLDDMQIFEDKFSNFKSQTDSELKNHKEIQKKLSDDIKSLQISCKSLSKSKESYSHSSSSSSKSHGHDLQKYLDDYRYEMDKMQTTRRKSEKTNDDMKRFYEKFHINIDEVRQKVKRMQRDIDRIERNSYIEDIEKFNKILKDYFSDSEKLHEKVSVFHDELEKSKRDNENVRIKCHTNQKELSTVKESLVNFQGKNDKINNDLKKINKELIGIKKNYREHNSNNSRKNSDLVSSSSSFEKIIDSETYKTVIDNLQLKQKMFIDINDDEINENLEKIVENVDYINSNNNSPKINQREIMNYLEKYQFNNRKETDNNFNKINEDIISIKRILNDFQLENNSRKTIYENIKEQQLKIDNRLEEIDKTLNENSIAHNTTNDLINNTIREIIEMKTAAEKYQNDTNSMQLDIQKSNENLFLITENLKRELEACRTKENRLQTEHNILNQEINRIKLELKNNSTDNEGIKYFFVSCENRFENIKNDVAINYSRIEMLKNNNADSWENIKRIGMDLEKLSKEIILIHKFNEDFRKIGKQKTIDESKSLEIYINKLKEENLKMETENNNNYKTFRKTINCNLKEYGTNIKKLSEQVKSLERKSDQLNESNESVVLQNSRIDQCNNDQIELKKNFEALSKSFRNLKTECLNRRSDLKSPQVIKKPNISRDWVVDTFQSKFQEAVTGESPYITSEWFNFADYKVGFKLYLKGDQYAKGHYLSIFCFIEAVKKDLPKRKLKLSLCLVDRVNGSHTVTKEYEYYNYIKQESVESSEEIVKNGLGTSKFISIDNLFSNSTYIKNDSILFRFSIIPFNQ